MTSATFAVSLTVAMAPILQGPADVVSTISIIMWQLGAGVVAYLFIRNLRGVARLVETVTEQVVTEREAVAARRAYAEERLRHFREHIRRCRALHDGPLRILRAIAGPGPAAHPDPEVRRQCAISVNVLRGAAPDDPRGTLTDLSLALIEAGNEGAALGLRVEYHFANLPEDLPPEVVTALSRAAAEALSNVAAHAGTTRVRLTALAAGSPGQQAVTVAVVDQGCGFDPATAPAGYGIRHSIVGRLADAGGQASVNGHPGQGTRVDLAWPASREEPVTSGKDPAVPGGPGSAQERVTGKGER